MWSYNAVRCFTSRKIRFALPGSKSRLSPSAARAVATVSSDVPENLTAGGTVNRSVDNSSLKPTEQAVIDRLLVLRSSRSRRIPYESLPSLSKAPDLQTNPRLASLVLPIDPRLLAPFYKDVDAQNGGLTFFKTGQERDSTSSFYVRSFMPHCHGGNSQYIKPGLSDLHSRPWQDLGTFLSETFASMGVTEFRDFYTHILPADVGRHLPHIDRLQGETWKVDIRFSPHPTELLVLDGEDKRWYALRFTAGGSGYVIDSALFKHFHALRAGPAIQQSVLAVFHKQGSTLHMVKEALSRRASVVPPLAVDYHSGSFPAFMLPPAPTAHAGLAETARVGLQAGKHIRQCLDMLRGAVRAVEPHDTSQARKREPKGRLSRVRASVVDQAIATLPVDVRSDVRKAYANHCKLAQQIGYGVQRLTAATKHGHLEAGRKRRAVLDDRLIAITGTATVGDSQFRFPEYDGTDATRLRFAWTRGSDLYIAKVSSDSGHCVAATLALLVKKLTLCKAGSSSSVSVRLEVVDGD